MRQYKHSKKNQIKKNQCKQPIDLKKFFFKYHNLAVINFRSKCRKRKEKEKKQVDNCWGVIFRSGRP